MSMPTLLSDDHDETTSVLCLNRPGRRNALNIELMRSICESIQSVSETEGKRAIILTASDPVFCAGLDLVEAADGTLAEQSADWVARLLDTVSNCPLVTIAAAKGAAYAGGAGLMAACDFVVASEDLRVCFPEVRRGLVPALASTVLRHKVRDQDLRELFLLAEPITANDAALMGLVNRIVPRDRLMEQALDIAKSMSEAAPQALRQTKQLLHSARFRDDADFRDHALQFHKQARSSDEAREGLRAFREKRRPDWRRP